MQNKLEEYNKLHPEIEAIYTGSSTGQFIQSPSIQMPDGYNPTERDWYKEAAKKAEKWLSQLHISQVQQGILLLQ